MSVWQKVRNSIICFMYGRNGMDRLNRALFIVYLVVWMIRGLLVMRGHFHVMVWDTLMWLLVVLIFFRTFSKNLSKRREENQKWVNWVWKIKSRQAGARARHADKDHKYFTCKNCKTICRVPVGKGEIEITCPKCGAKIRGRT